MNKVYILTIVAQQLRVYLEQGYLPCNNDYCCGLEFHADLWHPVTKETVELRLWEEPVANVPEGYDWKSPMRNQMVFHAVKKGVDGETEKLWESLYSLSFFTLSKDWYTMRKDVWEEAYHLHSERVARKNPLQARLITRPVSEPIAHRVQQYPGFHRLARNNMQVMRTPKGYVVFDKTKGFYPNGHPHKWVEFSFQGTILTSVEMKGEIA